MNSIDDLSPELSLHEDNEIKFYYVSTKAFIFYNILTWGLYLTYWFYKQWWAVKLHEKTKIKPMLRGLFCGFFSYSLFVRVNKRLSRLNLKPILLPGVCAVFFGILLILDNVLSAANPQDDFLFFTGIIFVILPLLPFQMGINKIIMNTHDKSEIKSSLTWKGISLIILFIILNAVIILGDVCKVI